MINNEKTYYEETIQKQKGKYIFCFILGIFIIHQVSIIIVGKPNFAQIVLFLFLVIFSFQGHKWARILLTSLYVFEGMFAFMDLVYIFSFQYETNGIRILVTGLLSLVSFISSSFLVFSEDVIAFLERDKVNTKQASKINWAEGVITLSSIPIALIVLGIIIELVKLIFARIYYATGVHDTTIQFFVTRTALYLAIPCGLLNIIVGNLARSRGLAEKKIAITGIVIGIIGVFIGLFMWIIYIMLLSFEF